MSGWSPVIDTIIIVSIELLIFKILRYHPLINQTVSTEEMKQEPISAHKLIALHMNKPTIILMGFRIDAEKSGKHRLNNKSMTRSRDALLSAL